MRREIAVMRIAGAKGTSAASGSKGPAGDGDVGLPAFARRCAGAGRAGDVRGDRAEEPLRGGARHPRRAARRRPAPSPFTPACATPRSSCTGYVALKGGGVAVRRFAPRRLRRAAQRRSQVARRRHRAAPGGGKGGHLSRPGGGVAAPARLPRGDGRCAAQRSAGGGRAHSGRRARRPAVHRSDVRVGDAGDRARAGDAWDCARAATPVRLRARPTLAAEALATWERMRADAELAAEALRETWPPIVCADVDGKSLAAARQNAAAASVDSDGVRASRRGDAGAAVGRRHAGHQSHPTASG